MATSPQRVVLFELGWISTGREDPWLFFGAKLSLLMGSCVREASTEGRVMASREGKANWLAEK